ncbi:hypothetical protein DV20_17475 [Amycolatopsis rifamycinica]|uniref:Tetracyclin repressor-like C-terminal domain-containing protein n=1 Tax=Amycolatopsis rifamycinica TaxID=287986 RepID=A0A066U9W6_9PSEU|nr:hypothetical protein DV20_17475 [Amycolatopsis rifamycinica]
MRGSATPKTATSVCGPAAVRRLARGFTGLLRRARDAGELNPGLDAEAFAWSLMSFVAARSFRRAVVTDPDLERRLVEQLLRTLGDRS